MGNILYYRHRSNPDIDPDNDNETWEAIVGWNVNIGENSIIGTKSGNLFFERINADHIEFLPAPFVFAQIGELLITDDEKPSCSDTKTVIVDQNNNIWCDDEFVAYVSAEDCCNKNTGDPEEQTSNDRITVTVDSWLDCTSATTSCFSADFKLEIVNANPDDNTFQIEIISLNCFDVDQYPIEVYVCDKNGYRIAVKTIYISIKHQSELKQPACKLSVSPPMFTVDYDDKDTFIGNFKYIAFSPQSNSKLIMKRQSTTPYVPDPGENINQGDEEKIYETIEEIVVDNFYGFISGHKTFDFGYNMLMNLPDTGITTNGYTGYTTWELCQETNNGDCHRCQEITIPIVVGRKKADMVLFDIYYDEKQTYIDSDEFYLLCSDNVTLFFKRIIKKDDDEEDQTDETQTEDNQSDDDQIDLFGVNCKSGTIPLNYKDIHLFKVDSGSASWNIYSYNNNKIACRKVRRGSNVFLEVKLVNYEEVRRDDAYAITLKNSGGDFFTLYYYVDEGLILNDEFHFNWEFSEDEIFTFDTQDDGINSNNLNKPQYRNEKVACCPDYYYGGYPGTGSKGVLGEQDPFKMESWYTLAIEDGLIKHTGAFSFNQQNAEYVLYKCELVLKTFTREGKTINQYEKTWVPINGSSYIINAETNIMLKYEKSEDSVVSAETENTEEGDGNNTGESEAITTKLYTTENGGKTYHYLYKDSNGYEYPVYVEAEYKGNDENGQPVYVEGDKYYYENDKNPDSRVYYIDEETPIGERNEDGIIIFKEDGDTWADFLHGSYNIYVNEIEITNAELGDIMVILKSTPFKTSTRTPQNGLSTCFLDFSQERNRENHIQLYIVHPGVRTYDIYTDQTGSIEVGVNFGNHESPTETEGENPPETGSGNP